MATSRARIFWLWKISRMASTMAVLFMSAPSTIASGGRGIIPKPANVMPRFESLSWHTLMDELPMSRPTASLPLAMSFLRAGLGALLRLVGGILVGVGAKDLVLVRHRHAQRQDDFSLGVQPAALACFHAVHRQCADACFAGQLSLAHQL